MHADQVGHHPGQRAGGDVEIQQGGAELGARAVASVLLPVAGGPPISTAASLFTI